MAPSTAVAPPQPLDGLLPAELSGRHHGWFTAYRRYPVFGAPWRRGRWRSLGGAALVVLLVSVVPVLLIDGTAAPWGGVLQLSIGVFAPLLAGPALGNWVRSRHLGDAREGALLGAALAAVVVAMLVFHGLLADPLKQWVAERTGMVDASGKRRQMTMAIGVSISSPQHARDAAHTPPPPASAGTEAPRRVRVLDAALDSLWLAACTFWLAGGAALWGWRRERRGLQALHAERQLAQAEAQRREAEMRLSVLAAQVEPHFLFNTLAGVRSAIATDAGRASEMIDRLVDYLRAAIPRLRSDGRVQATLGAQLEIVRAYLALMSARMPRLRHRVEAPPALLAAHCPPLMLISLVENAVKHGVERKVGPAHVDVWAEDASGGDLLVHVQDDGAGFTDAAGGSGLGLVNIRERLLQLYGTRASLELKARPEGGVIATLRLPLDLPGDATPRTDPGPAREAHHGHADDPADNPAPDPSNALPRDPGPGRLPDRPAVSGIHRRP